MAMKHKPIDVVVALGLEPILERCRIEFKNGALSVFCPTAIKRKMNIKHEKCLIGICYEDSLFLVKDTKLEELLRPRILEARKEYKKLKEKAKN